MKALTAVLSWFVIFVAGYAFRPTAPAASPATIERQGKHGQRGPDFKLSDIAKFEWVDKRCRMWAPDGDIDVDQTCLVGETVRGGLVVFPNPYNDEWFKEMAESKTAQDKWVQRFFAIGGGAK